MIRRFLTCVALAASAAASALANDTTAVLGLGGLEFVRTDAIAIEREDLFLSRREVRVRYQMRNLRAEPVTARIAFPLPAVPLVDPGGLTVRDSRGAIRAHLMDIPRRDHPNFVGFSVSVNGQWINPEMEIRALLPDGRDITQDLRRIGGWSLMTQPQELADSPLPIESFAQAHEVGPTIMRQLRELGAIGRDDGPGDPLWNTFITYHWQQTFPPGVTVVEHRYQPIVGATPFQRRLPNGFFDRWAGVEYSDQAYCIDPDKNRILNEVERSAPSGRLHAMTLAYVLTTGANWAGPIKEFHLIVDGADKSPRNRGNGRFVSVCAEIPMQQTAPLRWEGHARDYTPTHDLRALIIVGP